MIESSNIFIAGGPVMYILAACSVVAGAIILERLFFWFVEWRRGQTARVERLCMQLTEGKEDVASPRTESALISKLRARFKVRGAADCATLLRAESHRAYERGVRNLSALDTVVSIAPLLGILGTVLGIMKSFHALDFQHMASPGAVGHGLAEAMITTAVGLAIAVPTLVFYNFFHSLATRNAGRLFSAAENLIHADIPEQGVEE